MSSRTLQLLGLSLMFVLGVAFTQTAKAADEGKKEGKGGGLIANILKHADDLKLTDEQKTKLEALAKEPPPEKPKDGEKPKGGGPLMEKVKAILTPEQMEKLKEFKPKKDK